MEASQNGNIDVVRHLAWWTEHKADVHAKDAFVSTALMLFDSFIGLRLFGTAVVSAEALHRAIVGLRAWPY